MAGVARGGEGLVRNRKVLVVALSITSVFFAVEVVGAFLTNSLALLADAAHMLTDVVALGLALFAIWFAARPHSLQRGYGYYRVEILAALGNGFALWIIAAYIFFEASSGSRAPWRSRAVPCFWWLPSGWWRTPSVLSSCSPIRERA